VRRKAWNHCGCSEIKYTYYVNYQYNESTRYSHYCRLTESDILLNPNELLEITTCLLSESVGGRLDVISKTICAMYQSSSSSSYGMMYQSGLGPNQGQHPTFSVAQAISNLSSTANNLASSSTAPGASSSATFRPPAHKHAHVRWNLTFFSIFHELIYSFIFISIYIVSLRGRNLLGHSSSTI
jgi:hypothetical protein